MFFKNKNFRNIFIIFLVLVVAFVLLLLTSCRTTEAETVASRLPAFTATRPERPSLLTVEDGVQIPREVVVNETLLIGYAMKLEVYADAWEQYYIQLTAL